MRKEGKAASTGLGLLSGKLLALLMVVATALGLVVGVAGNAAAADGDAEFVLTDKLEAGKEYLIANGNTGDVYVISNENNGSSSKQLKGVSVTVSGEKIVISEATAEKVAFECLIQDSASGTTGAWLKNGEDYLYTDSSNGLRLVGSSTQTSSSNSSKVWHYIAKDNGNDKYLLWFFKDASGDDGYTNDKNTYKYYLTCTDGIFADAHVGDNGDPSLANKETPKIYLFARDIPEVSVTGVKLDKSSEAIYVGSTLQLTATVEPAKATNKKVTWESSKPEVASVDQSGKVTGVAEGAATITVTTEDGSKTATCAVTVKPTPKYQLATTLEDGGEYLIVNDAEVGSSSSRALKNPGGTSSGATVSYNNGKTTVKVLDGNIIETADTDIVWTATTNGSGFTLSNDGDYVEARSSSLKVYDKQNNADAYWTYSGTELKGFGDYERFMSYAGGSFTSVESDATGIYLFKKVTGEAQTVNVENVELDKSNETIFVGGTLQLKATVSPNNATNKKVTWESSKPEVASVDQSGEVTGEAEGDATITVTTEDGGKTATCKVTVSKATETKYVEVKSLVAGKHYVLVAKSGSTNYAMKYGSTPSPQAITITEATGGAAAYVMVPDTDEGKTLVWNTTDGSSAGYVYLVGSGGNTLYFSSGSISTSSSSKRNTDLVNGKLVGKGNSSNYYVTFDGEKFGSISGTESSGADFRIFIPESEVAPVTGVTLDKDTLELVAGKTGQLTATVAPAGATNKDVTWSSDKTDFATVDQNGLVTAVAEGTATITVTTEDGGKTATCTVKVTKAPDPVKFVLTDEIVDGGEYLIVNTLEEGSSRALKNPGGNADGVSISSSNGKTEVKVQDDSFIMTADTDIVWTASTNGEGFNLSNDGSYIEGSGGNSIKSYKPIKNADRYWTYSDGQLFHHNGTTSTYTVYYNNGTFTATTSSNTGKVYLFKKDTGDTPTVNVESVELDPTTIEIAATKTGQLKATVSPAGATNKKVTWSSSDEKVATVDQKGVVTGVAEGTATITVTTEDGGKTATCAVTVTKAPEAVKFVLTDELEDGGEYLIVNTTTAGSAYALKNPGGTSSGVATTSSDKTAVTILDDDSIMTGDTDIVWTATENDQGFNLSNDGSYIEGYYSNGEKLYVFKPQNYPTRYWTYKGNQLKHNGGTSAYTLCYSNSTFTTTRTSGNTDEVYLYKKLTEQVDVTGVTVDPKTASVEAGRSVQLSASVTPANASNKKVTWSSSDEKIATVDQTGKVKGVAEGEVTITAASKENDTIKDSCKVTVTRNTLSDKRFLILIGDHALTNQPTNDQLINNNGNYVYSGLAGADYVAGGIIDETMSWILEETEGGYYIKSEDGKYLNATYTSVSNPSASNPTTGVLKLDDTKDVWSISGDLESWELDGSKLKSANSTKYLNYESGTTDAPINLFTVRSESNAASTKIVEISSTPVETFTVTFLNDDGTELSSRKYATGTKAADIEKPANPTKQPTVDTAYTFDKWTPDIVDVTADATYTATYTSAPRQYTVKFVDEDGTTVLKAEEKYNYGTPWERVEKPEDPTKDGYTFAGWTNAPETITADVVVKASYSKNVKVTFVDDDGKTVLKDETEYPIGVAWADIEKPADPTKDSIGGMTFTFDGWDPQVETVTANTVFKATYKKSSTTGDKWLRLKGKDRYKTMSAIVSAGFKSSDAIVLASGEKFADALVASALAGALDCPIVLTEKDTLTPEAKKQIEALRPTDVYVVGSTGAISQAVRDQVHDMIVGYDEGAILLPLGGSTRIETSRIVAGMVIGLDPAADTVVIATGENFADALAVSPWCYAKHYPIMLADKNGNLSDDQIDDIVVKYAMKKAVIVGGNKVVSDDVAEALEDEGLTVERWKGSNRYDTAAKIAKNELKDGLTMTNVAVATGNNFADALAGAALCGHNNSILVLAESENHKTSPALDIIESRADEITLGYILGGTGAVSESLEAHLNDLTD